MKINMSRNLSYIFYSSKILCKADYINIAKYMYDKVSSSFLPSNIAWSEITVMTKDSKFSYSLDEFINNFSASENIVEISIMIGFSKSGSYVSLNSSYGSNAYITVNSTTHTKAQVEDLLYTLDKNICQMLLVDEQSNSSYNQCSSADSKEETFLKKPIVFWTGIAAMGTLVGVIISFFK